MLFLDAFPAKKTEVVVVSIVLLIDMQCYSHTYM